jgi:catechol 2,3-dioxygenase-like lactoylglutathione lyase family enzyme
MVMERAVPVLQIDDADEAKAFYVDKLGFGVAFEWRHEPGFPVFMGVRKGDLYLLLSEHGRGHPGTDVSIFINDITAWHKCFMETGVSIERGPDKQPWGNTEILVKDPHRNALCFIQIDTHKPTAKSA